MFKTLKPKSEFSRNVLTLMTGTTIAQAIPIAISPILTRIYTPEDFGIFALYLSIASIVAVMATGRYELAIMLPKKDEDASQIVFLSLLITFLLTLVLFGIVFVFNHDIVSILEEEQLAYWLYFIPLSVLFTGVYQSFNYWNNRQKAYKRLANSKVTQSVTSGGITLGMGFGASGSGGLIVGHLMGQGMIAIIFSIIFYRGDYQRFKALKPLKMYALLKKYKKLPLLNLPNAVIDSIRFAVMNILIAKLFTTMVLGQFSLAWKMLQAPMALIGSALSQVFFQKIASSKKEELLELVKSFMTKAFLFALPIFVLIYFFAVEIFSFVFGENWAMAGEIASILTPWLLLNFLSSPLANVFVVLNRQEVVLVVSVIYMLVPIVTLLLLYEYGFLYALQWVTLLMSLILILYIAVLFMYLLKERDNVLQR